MEQQAALDIDLGSIFSLSTVQVVQSIDVQGLQQALKWIVAKLGQQNDGGRCSSTDAAVEALIQQNTSLQEEVKELKQHQSTMMQTLDSKADRDQLPGKEVLQAQGLLTELQARMDALEGGAAGRTAGRATGGAEGGAAGGSPDVSARLDAIERALEDLQRSMEGAGGGSGSPGERSFREPEGADPPMRLQSPATRPAALQQALDELEQRLDTKANKSAIKDIWAQLQSMQPQGAGSGGSGSEALTALSRRVRELEEDRAVGLEALEAAVASLKDAVAGKADAERVQSIGDKVAALAVDKADQTGLDELRLRMAVAAPGAAAVAAGGAAEGGVGGSDALVQLIQGMLEEKAGRAEVAQLKVLVDAKAGTEELEALRSQFIVDGAPAVAAVASAGDLGVAPDTFALKEDLSRLADQVGDMYAEIEKLRQEGPLAALARQQMPGTAAGAGAGAAALLSAQQAAGADGQAESRLLPIAVQDSTSMHVLQELQVLKEQVEMVAHAANIIAVGLEARGLAGGAGGADGSGGMTPGSPAPNAALTPSTGKESRQPQGAYARLVKRLGSQGFNQKMDHFDPEVLNRMAQKLAYVDALLKNPSFARGQGAEDLGIRELEAQMRKMGRDIRAVKQAQATGMGPQGEGEHAMLAGKPILGYRCMACDRPIEKLDDRAGPHVPTNQMTSKVMLGKPDISKTVLKSPTDTPPNTRKKAAYDPSARGPQTWYEDQRNIAADGLPAADVGPKLAPGGWRSSASGAPPPSGRPNNLPDLSNSAPRPTSPQIEPQARSPAKSGPIYDLPVLPRIS